MNNNTIQKASETKRKYVSAYGRCIGAIVQMMKSSKISHVNINYDILEPRCYNVNNTSGEYDCNTVYKIALEEDGLELCDAGDNIFPIGTDENGQDGYTILNPEILLMKVAEFIDRFHRERLLPPAKRSAAEMINAIKAFIGEDRVIAFEQTYERPLIKGEPVVQITHREIETITSDHVAHRTPLNKLSRTEIHDLITAINDYILYCYNKKKQSIEHR